MMQKFAIGTFILVLVFSCRREPVAPPRALFLVNKKTLEINEILYISNRSLRMTNCSWDFGDGQGSTLNNPTHYYSEEGEYTITLQVENDLGTDDTVRIIQVVRPEILWPAPGEYTGITEQNGNIEMHIADKQIDRFQGSFFARISDEIYELNSSFVFGAVYKTDTSFIASYKGNVLNAVFSNDTITGLWKHKYGEERFIVVKQ